jgi:hypothetical protein
MFAYTIVLAHSMVFHVHHDHQHATAQTAAHEGTGDLHHHDGENDALPHDLGDYTHATASDVLFQLMPDGLSLPAVSGYPAFTYQFDLAAPEFRLPPGRASTPSLRISDPRLLTKGLRAPPAA